MGHCMSLWLVGGAILVQPDAGRGRTRSLSHPPSAKIAYGNSQSRHGHTHHSTPVTPLPRLQKLFPLRSLPVFHYIQMGKVLYYLPEFFYPNPCHDPSPNCPVVRILRGSGSPRTVQG